MTRRTLWHRVVRTGLCLLPLMFAGCKQQTDSGASGDAAPPQPTSDAAPVVPAGQPTTTFTLPDVDVTNLPPGIQTKIGALRSALRSTPNAPLKAFELGALYLAHNQTVPAVQCFRHAADLEPGNLSWLYALALAQERARQFEAARATLEQVAAAEREQIKSGKLPQPHWPGRVRLGALLCERDTPRAVEIFQEILTAIPGYPPAVTGLARCRELEGKKEEARQTYEQALESAPDYGPAHAALARLLKELGQPAEAARHEPLASADEFPVPLGDRFEIELLRAGWHLQVLLSDAQNFAAAGQFDQARAMLSRALEVDPGYSARYVQGLVLASEGKLDEASRVLRSILSQYPEATYIKHALAQVLADMNQKDQAVQLLREYLDEQPTQLQALADYCRLMSAAGRGDEAVAMLERARAAAPDNTATRVQIGELYALLGKFDVAMQLYREAVERDPRSAPAQAAFGAMLARRGELAEARAHLTEAVRLAPDRVAFRYNLLGVLFELREFRELVQAAREGVALAPESAALLNSLAWALATCPVDELRSGAEAVELAEKACRLTNFSDFQILDTLAAAYAEVGRFEDALRRVDEAIRLARAAKLGETVKEFEERRATYQQNTPYRTELAPGPPRTPPPSED